MEIASAISFKDKVFKKNYLKCKNIVNKNLFDNKNFFYETLTKQYQKNILRNKVILKDNIIFVGMGGSVLGAKMLNICNKSKKKFIFLDNLDSNFFKDFKKKISNCSIVVVSKSGSTLETLTNLNILIKKKYNFKNIIVVSSLYSDLHAFAVKFGCQFIEHPRDLSGRFSLLSIVNLIFFDFSKKDIISGIQSILNKKLFSVLIKNSSLILTLIKKNYNTNVSLIYSNKLLDFSFWYQQLLAESIGKKENDFLPFTSVCPKDYHSLMQLYLGGKKNKFYTFFYIKKNNNIYFKDYFNNKKKTNLSSITNAQFAACIETFREKKLPYRIITLNSDTSIKEIIALSVYLMLETIVICKALNLNPFNQPDVESIKKKTREILT
jgi:glucose-6-phosphate isomerase